MGKSLLRLLVLLLLLLPASIVRSQAPYPVAPGVEYRQEHRRTEAGSLVLHLLKVNLKQPGVRVVSALAGETILADDSTEGRETTGDTARRLGAIAAVNTDFFPFSGDPLGLMIRGGELLSEGMPHRVALGIDEDGSVSFGTFLALGEARSHGGTLLALDGLHRQPRPGEAVLQGPVFAARPRGPKGARVLLLRPPAEPLKLGAEWSAEALEWTDLRPDLKLGEQAAVVVSREVAAAWEAAVRPHEPLRIRFDLIENPLPPGPPRGDLPSRAATLRGRIPRGVWTTIQEAAGGGPWLVRDGAIRIDGEEQGFSPSSFVRKRHPRTAAGVTAAGELLLVVADGRQSFSQGATLEEMAEAMLRFGAVQAINLDGGGSSAMWIHGAYVNGPSDGAPRAVSNSLLVFAEGAVALPETVLDPVRLAAGETARVALPEGALPALFGIAEGKAFVDREGRLSARRAFEGSLLARSATASYRIPVTVAPGQAAALSASLGSVANNPPDRNSLAIAVRDRFGNGVPGVEVRIRAEGGTPDRASAVTDSAGRAIVEIVWDVEKGRKAAVSVEGLKSVTLTAK